MYKIAILLLLASACVQAQQTSESITLQSAGASTAPAAGASPASPNQLPSVVNTQNEGSRWFWRIGAVGALYHSGATISTSGAIIPSATALVSNNVSLTFDVGYDITKNISAQLMTGIPPKPAVTGEGTVAALGGLGAVRYGPAILSGLYKLRRFAGFQPYAGAGAAYAIILKDHDGSVSDLHVRNNFGFVLQGGAEHKLAGKWTLFADFKEIWLAVDGHGLISGVVPVTAHIKLNPSLVSSGLKFHF